MHMRHDLKLTFGEFTRNLQILLYTWHLLHLSIRGEGSSSVALLKVSSLFFPVEGFFLFLRSFFWSDVRSKVMDVVCVQIVKPSEANLWFWSTQNKMNWIEWTKSNFYCCNCGSKQRCPQLSPHEETKQWRCVFSSYRQVGPTGVRPTLLLYLGK